MGRIFRLSGRWWQVGAVCVTLGMIIAACGSSSSAASTGAGGSSTGGSSAGSGGNACTTSNVVVNGISTEKFCGPAKAQATFQGQTFSWSQGACFNQAEGAGVNIGQEVLDPTNSTAGTALKKQYDYFGAEAQASKDGAYQGLLAGFYHGNDITAQGTVTFTNNLQAGTFTGQTIIGQVAVTASWTCA